jgi:hypothetical protein
MESLGQIQLSFFGEEEENPLDPDKPISLRAAELAEGERAHLIGKDMIVK